MTTEPTLIRSGAAGWPAAQWTFSSLAERVGDVQVVVHTGRWRRRRWVATRDGATVRQSARAYLHALDQGHSEGYLAGYEVFQRVPALRADLGFRDTGPFRLDVAWIGPAGATTPLHRDAAPNLYAQLRGRKRWRLWRPESRLVPLWAYGFQMSARTVDDAGEPWLDVVLEPGDLLEVPRGWWHQVDTLEPSIAVNRWWRLERLGRHLRAIWR